MPRSKKGENKRTTRKGSAAAKKSTKKTTSSKPASDDVVIDVRSGDDRRKSKERRQQDEPVAVERRNIQRRAKVNRRRQIDPTTCERDYSVEEIEFMNALDDYKRASGRMFPTCSEILEVVKNLGYEKRSALASSDQTEQDEGLAGDTQNSPAEQTNQPDQTENMEDCAYPDLTTEVADATMKLVQIESFSPPINTSPPEI